MGPAEYRVMPGEGLGMPKTLPASGRALTRGEVRVQVKAVGLNARDAAIVAGQYPVPHSRPLVPCSDGAGVVTEVGPEVVGLSHGDRVVSCFFRDWLSGPPTSAAIAHSHGCELDGLLATEAILHASALVPIPDAIDYEAAACAPCAGVTAWNALFEFGRLRPGQTVVIQGTGGVATWAAQLAVSTGLQCIVVSSSKKKLSQLPTDPALAHIDTAQYPAWAAEVARLTQGRGAELIIELGGAETIGESLQASAIGGKIALIGGLSGWSYDGFNSLEAVIKQLTLRGIYVGSRDMLESLLQFMEMRSINPLISKKFEFENAEAAFSAMASTDRLGKVVVTL